MKTVNPKPIELPYYDPSQTFNEITICGYSDGGVTIIIPPRKMSSGEIFFLAVGVIILVAQTTAMTVGFFVAGLHAWSLFITIYFLVMLPITALIWFAYRYRRNLDPNEVLAISPDIISIKPARRKPRSIRRDEFRRLEVHLRRRSKLVRDFDGIELLFKHSAFRIVCAGRTESETQTVAEALQKALDATVPTHPK